MSISGVNINQVGLLITAMGSILAAILVFINGRKGNIPALYNDFVQNLYKSNEDFRQQKIADDKKIHELISETHQLAAKCDQKDDIIIELKRREGEHINEIGNLKTELARAQTLLGATEKRKEEMKKDIQN